MEFSKLLIKEGKYWDVKIHHNQNCLGKCLLWYKGCSENEEKDFADLNGEEQKEFWDLLKKTKDILVKLFHPDKINYASLGMATSHLHFHIIPRYENKKLFEGIEFFDENWGKFPPTGENEISESVLLRIRDSIKWLF